MNIGLIGCGTIGTELALFIDRELDVELSYIDDIDENKTNILLKKLKNNNPKIADIDELINNSDLIIEAASKEAVEEILNKVIEEKKDLMVMSVGGLIKNIDLLKKIKSNLYIPSGAICGIDGIKSANIGKISSVTIITTKPPKGLQGAPYITNNNIDLNNIKNKKIIFEGNVIEAVKGFPKNINVAATLSLAGIGPEKTKVKIQVDPNSTKNMHEIEAIGEFGKLKTTTENMPSPNNPKTSYLAVLSACATLKNIVNKIKIGN